MLNFPSFCCYIIRILTLKYINMQLDPDSKQQTKPFKGLKVIGVNSSTEETF